ncbi:MAG: DUF349 domain-containing protein [Burkholderiales bacterium]|nr:DUF349 domain-containing protein [Burkholderiales bacterium]
MLNWLYKKFNPARTTAPQPAKAGAVAPAPKPVRPLVDWSAQLRSALGNDVALLQVAKATDVLAVKLEAVQALATEESLKQAERQFRNHDRKVHRLCKQRLDAAMAQREARSKAQALLARTHALLAEAEVPANHVVTLDREWTALAPPLLEPQQTAAFAALRGQLDALMRERTEAQRQQQRQWQQWSADVQHRLVSWPGELMALAEQGNPGELGTLHASLDALRATRPHAGANTALDLALAKALQTATQVQARLDWMAALRPAASATPDAEGEATPTGPTAAEVITEPAPQPPPAAMPIVLDGALAQVLDQRYAQWALAQRPAKAARTPQAAATARPARAAKPVPLDAARLAELDALAQQAEAALTEGHVSESQRHLQALERSTAAEQEAALPESLRSRRQALRAELTRLKSWQQWGGERAREELTAQAETLAAQTPAPAQALAPAAGEGEPPAEPAIATKLNLKTHADAIRQLRQRWKQLDRAGGPANATQWQRFDAALQTAYLPVSAQQAQVKAARQDNLAAREALLAALLSLPLPDAEGSAAAPGAWREPLRELDRFQQAWRQFGPVEHTVPAAAREPLLARLRQALDRIEQPLDAVRRLAAAAREPLIGQAEALVADLDRPGAAADAMPEALRRVRDLQAAWQEAARQIPLARPVETALWTRFKAATDAVYAKREAAFAEREAELSAHMAEREALLARLDGLADQASPADLSRTLAEVEAAWRLAADVPRGASEALEARFRAARAQVQQRLAAAASQRWQALSNSLAARLALCVAREDDPEDAATADAAQRWAACAPLPPAWEQALTLRWTEPVAAGPLSAAAVDSLLLQLEVAWNQPSAPEWQDARRQLKLQGLKHALERRGAAQQPGPPAGNADQALVQLLRQGQLGAAQRQRLQALVAVLPSRP